MNQDDKTEALHQIAEQAVPDTLDLWPEIRSRAAAIRPPRPSPVGGAPPAGHSRRRLLAGVTAAVLLAVILGAASLLSPAAEPVSAQAILDKAQSAVSSPVAVNSYHLQMTTHAFIKGNTTFDAEVWFDGLDRQRRNTLIKDANGAVISSDVEVFAGDQAWIAQTGQGQTRVVHTTGTSWTKPSQDISWTQYTGNPKLCLTPQQQDEATVAGRAAYVITLGPTSGGCPGQASGANVEQGAAVKKGDGQGAKASQSVQLRIWVDKVSFLTLKSEIRDSSGTLLVQTEVKNVEYGVAIPASLFSYSPPPGATVSNFTGADPGDVKGALSGATGPSVKP